jgi:peptide/nickel transport system substrate-binding protein
MRTRSKGLGGFVAIAAASVLAISACGTSGGGGNKTAQSSPGFASCEEKPNTCNNGPTKQGGSIVVALEKTISNWNTADSDGNTYEQGQVLSGILPSPFISQPDNSVGWNKILLQEEPKITVQKPQTVVYKLKKEAVWDDGTPIDYKDFQLYWKMNNGKDCPDCTPASTTGYELIKSIEGTDDGKTVTVTFNDDATYPDWQGLFALFPQHLAGDWSTPAGVAKAFDYFKNTPTWSGWAYKFKDYVKDVSVTLVPNPKFWGPKPTLDQITFKIVEDQAQQLPAMKNKELQMLISQPSGDMVTQVQGMAGVNYNLSKGPTWEHVDLNTQNAALKDVALRQAIFTAVDRQSIIDKTVGSFFKGAAPLNNHNIMVGASGYKDVITPTGQGKGDIEKAKSILTAAGYKIDGGKLIDKSGQPVPQLRFRYTTGNTLRQQTAELFQAAMKQIGVDIKIDPTAKLGNTLSTGDYDIIVFAWVGTPFMSGNKDLWGTKGGSNYGKWSNADADKLLDEAAQTLDPAKVRELLNQADEIMSKEAYVLPLYQKPVFLAVYSDYINIRNNPTNAGPAYNIEQWGLKADSVK